MARFGLNFLPDGARMDRAKEGLARSDMVEETPGPQYSKAFPATIGSENWI